MWKVLAVSMCLMPVAAQAFTQCTATALTGPKGEIAEEGSNPVAFNNWVYAGYVDGLNVGVAASSDAGKTLAAPAIIDTGSHAHFLRLAAQGKSVYATWRKQMTDGWHVAFATSRANGAAGSWNKPLDLGPGTTNIGQIAAAGNAVYIAYLSRAGNVSVLASRDSGKTFAAPVSLGAGWGEIVVTAHDDHVDVAWEQKADAGRHEVWLSVSSDEGATFKTQDMSTGRAYGGLEPIFTTDTASGRVSLVWRDQDPASTGYYLNSTDGGQSWSTPLAIDAGARQFMVADDGSTIYVSYLKEMKIDGVPDWQVQLATSTDGGVSFPKKQNLTGMTGISKIINDDFRPIPWVRGERAFRLTGVEADGVHMWNGNNGKMSSSAFLGPGYIAAPALDSAVWFNSDGVVSYGVCK
jgi:hypothetical protein